MEGVHSPAALPEILALTDLQLEPAALESYIAEARALARRVTERVLADPAFTALRSAVPPALLDNNHRNHALFMAEVLQSSAWGALARALPWVYYSRRGQGVPYAYFPIELGAWQAVVVEHLGSSGAGIVRVYQRLLQVHERVVSAAEALKLQRSRSVAAASSQEGAFYRALVEADGEGLMILCREFLADDHSFVDLLEHAFRPALVEIGACWADGSVSVDQEHRATATANLVLSSLYVEQPVLRLERGHAIVATVAGDPHKLGAWMIAAALEADGWEVSLLNDAGNGNAVRDTLLARETAFIALSATMLAQLSNLRGVILRLRQCTAPGRLPPIVVGGQALAEAPELFDTLRADAMLFSIDSIIHWSRPLSVDVFHES